MEKKERDVGMEGQNRRRSPAVRLFFSLSFFFVTIVTLELLNEILCSFSALFFIGFSISSIFFSSLILYMVM